MKKNIFTTVIINKKIYLVALLCLFFQACSDSEYKKHVAEGENMFAEGKYEEAAKYYSLALTINPKEKNSLFLRGEAYMASKEYEKAIKDFNTFLEVTGQTTSDKRAAYVKRGLCFAALKKYRLSLNDYQSALAKRGKTSDIYYARGKLYLQIEAFKRAKSDLKFALKLDTKNKYIPTTLGKYYFFKKQYKSATKYLKMALAIDPDYEAAIYFLGRAHLKNNNRSLAFDACNHLGKIGSPLKDKLLKMYLSHKDTMYKKRKPF